VVGEYLSYVGSFCKYCGEDRPCLRHRAVLRLLLGEPVFTVRCRDYYILLVLDDYGGKLIPYRYNSTSRSFEFIEKVRPYGDVNVEYAELPFITVGMRRFFTRRLCTLNVVDAQEPYVSKMTVRLNRNIFVFSHNYGLHHGIIYPLDVEKGIILASKLDFEELTEEPVLLNWNRCHLDALVRIGNDVYYIDMLNHETYHNVMEGERVPKFIKKAVEKVVQKAQEETTETVKGDIVSVWDYVRG